MAEKKIFDTGVYLGPGTGNGFPNQTSNIYSISDVTPGFNDNQRIGDKITMSSLQFNYESYPGILNSTVPGYIPQRFYMLRVTVFIWKDDSNPGPSDILDPLVGQLTGTFTPTDEPTEMLNHDKKVKRRILFDKITTQFYDPAPAGMALGTGVQHPFLSCRESIDLTKVGNLNIINFQSGGTVGVNKIWVSVKANVGAATPDEVFSWFFKMNTRINYVDM